MALVAAISVPIGLQNGAVWEIGSVVVNKQDKQLSLGLNEFIHWQVEVPHVVGLGSNPRKLQKLVVFGSATPNEVDEIMLQFNGMEQVGPVKLVEEQSQVAVVVWVMVWRSPPFWQGETQVPNIGLVPKGMDRI